MLSKRGFRWVLIGLQLLVSFSLTNGERLILDTRSDLSEKWFDISCIYADDPAEYAELECPARFPAGDSKFPEWHGYWAPCTNKTCEIHYHGGFDVPHPKSVSFGFYAQGNISLAVSSRYGRLDEEEFNAEKELKLADVPGLWTEMKIDMSEKSRALVLKFTLTATTTPFNLGALFLDKIIIDLGDESTFPPELPPSTTPLPLNGDLITLDRDNENWIVWSHNCYYLDELTYMWAYGCPEYSNLEDVSIGSRVGFWSSCSKPKCTLKYTANAAIAQPIPSNITISSYLEGNAKLEVVLQTICLNCSQFIPIGSVSAPENGGWVTKTINVEGVRSKSFMINIDLIPGNGGRILVDEIQMKLKDQTAPGNGEDGENGDNGSTSAFRMEWTALLSTLAIATLNLLR